MKKAKSELKNIKFMDIKSKGGNAKAVHASAKGSKLIVENCDFINNKVTSDIELLFGTSSVILIKSGIKAEIINCNFINPNNKIEAGNNDWVIINYGKLIVNNTNFSDVTDGFIYSFRDDSRLIATLDINNCSFINSHSSKNGGAISSDYFNINNSSFINCSGNNGGAIYLLKSSTNRQSNINNCYFENCKATDVTYGFGGALYVSKNSEIYLNNNTFSECFGKGSVICNLGNTILNNSIIKNSKIYVVTNMYGYYLGSILNDYGTLSVISSIFENNTCFKTWYTGTHISTAGIYNRGTLDVSYSAFINNTKIKNIGRFENLNMYEDVYTESSDVKSLDFNWWSNDENPTDLGLSNYEKINNWIYLDIAPEYLALNINETAKITANFKLNNPNIAFDSGKIPNFNITFSSVENDKFLYESKNLVNNSASVVFDLTQTKGQYVLLTSIGVYSKPTIIDVGKNVSLMNVSVSDIIYGNDLKVNVSVMNNQSQSLKGNVTFKIKKHIMLS